MFVFQSMNTQVAVTASADEETIAAQVAIIFAKAEHRFSRFRADSELSALNRADGPFVASRELFDMLVRARAYLDLSEGLFDPGLGATLSALGYDRSFAPGALDRRRADRRPPDGGFRNVTLDPDTRTVWRPRHVQIDLGGIAKGRTVDLAAAQLAGSGAIDAGGDAVMRGSAPGGEPWLVEIEDPANPTRAVATVAVSSSAVATSAGNRRRWRVGENVVHHLIDPRTRTSSDRDLAQATVFAKSAERADVLAKTTFLLGAHEGRAFLDRQPGVAAVLVPKSGGPLFVGALDVREVAHA